MLHTEGTLKVVVHSAQEMQNVEKMGKQDPYVRFALDVAAKEWPKTFTAKDAGANATWNQTLETPLHGEQDLFVEAMDEEKGVDEVIGFCAIKLAPIVQAPGGHVNAVFPIFDIKGNGAGRLHLAITAFGFNSPPAAPQQQQPLQGQAYIHEEHVKRVKSMKHKAVAGDVGTAVLGGALAIGAGLLGHKLYKDHEQKEQMEEEQRLQMERLEQERRQMEDEQRRPEHDEAEERRRRHEDEQRRMYSGGGSSSSEEHHHKSSSHHHPHHQHHHGGASEWDPVGTYAAGDRVEYHGHSYVCLQGHTSNPTWMPGAAHSLWQPM